MTTTKKPWKHLTIALLVAAITCCATNQPQLVYSRTPTKLDSPVQPPANFVVTLDEARSAIPIPYSKVDRDHWAIYADRTHYYLVTDLTGPKVRSPHSIRHYGYPISGLTRHDIDRVNQARPITSTQKLARILPNNASKPTP